MAVTGTVASTMTGKVSCAAKGWVEVEHSLETYYRMTFTQRDMANQDNANLKFTQQDHANIVVE